MIPHHDCLTFKQLWLFYLRYDVREARWFYVAPGRGYYILYGNYPDSVLPPYSRVWSYSTALRYYRSVCDSISRLAENGLPYEPVVFVNLFNDSIEVPF